MSCRKICSFLPQVTGGDVRGIAQRRAQQARFGNASFSGRASHLTYASSSPRKPRVGVLGSGNVGKKLAGMFRDKGHPVVIGARNLQGKPELQQFCEDMGIEAVPMKEAAEFCEVAVLATAWQVRSFPEPAGAYWASPCQCPLSLKPVRYCFARKGTEDALEKAEGVRSLFGKIVLDATNPLTLGPNGLEITTSQGDSGGEQVQRWLPKAKIVKVMAPQSCQSPRTIYLCTFLCS